MKQLMVKSGRILQPINVPVPAKTSVNQPIILNDNGRDYRRRARRGDRDGGRASWRRTGALYPVDGNRSEIRGKSCCLDPVEREQVDNRTSEPALGRGQRPRERSDMILLKQRGWRKDRPHSVMDGQSALAAFIKSSLPKLREVEPLLEVLQELGVQELEDLSYIQESDLHVLKPVEVRKLLSHFKTTSQRDVLDSPLSNQQSSNTAWKFSFGSTVLHAICGPDHCE
ncbi:uncharacterized protein [Trachinotus anak]|uniref:uncharacterized protein n=1 Tax=Trachinotus anak TaxID=443729 RepID=UPI0039F19F60